MIYKFIKSVHWFVSVSLTACNPYLAPALDKAGANREDIEKVLGHFKNDPDNFYTNFNDVFQ